MNILVFDENDAVIEECTFARFVRNHRVDQHYAARAITLLCKQSMSPIVVDGQKLRLVIHEGRYS